MILGTVQAVKTRGPAVRRSSRNTSNRKRKLEVQDQQCSSTKRRRGAPRKELPAVVVEFLNSKSVFSTRKNISMLISCFLENEKYQTMSASNAKACRYYYNKKFTDKPFFKNMMDESRMRSRYFCWKNSYEDFDKKTQFLLG